jgi:hypothetical protein
VMIVSFALTRRRGARHSVCTVAAAFLLAALTLAGSVHGVAAATFPAATKSWYVTNYSTAGWYSRGCTLGTAALNNYNAGITDLQHTLVILDFATQIQSGGTWGTEWTEGDRVFHPWTQARDVIVEYAHGFYVCTGADTTATVNIGAGTRNIFWTGVSRSTEGLAWAQLVTTFRNSLGTYGTQADVFGAIDAEPNWSTATDARAWGTAYSNAGGRQPYYDYGAASGCPPAGSCNNGWAQADEYDLAWGFSAAFAAPEIYATSGTNATQWQQISLWGVTHSRSKIAFTASVTQSNACATRSCPGTNNTPLQGWTQLTNALNSDARTSGSVPDTTDFDWN